MGLGVLRKPMRKLLQIVLRPEVRNQPRFPIVQACVTPSSCCILNTPSITGAF